MCVCVCVCVCVRERERERERELNGAKLDSDDFFSHVLECNNPLGLPTVEQFRQVRRVIYYAKLVIYAQQICSFSFAFLSSNNNNKHRLFCPWCRRRSRCVWGLYLIHHPKYGFRPPRLTVSMRDATIVPTCVDKANNFVSS